MFIFILFSYNVITYRVLTIKIVLNKYTIQVYITIMFAHYVFTFFHAQVIENMNWISIFYRKSVPTPKLTGRVIKPFFLHLNIFQIILMFEVFT